MTGPVPRAKDREEELRARLNRAGEERPFAQMERPLSADDIDFLIKEVAARGAGGAPLNLRGAGFTTSLDLRGHQLKGAILEEAALSGATLTGVSLEGAYLAGAHLEGAHLEGANLVGAHLSHLPGGTGGAEQARTAADLNGAYLTGAKLTGSDLRHVTLIGAHLGEARLDRAQLESADLTDADLREASLQAVCAPNTIFTGASLEGAKLTNACLAGVTLDGVTCDPRTNLSGACLGRACEAAGTAVPCLGGQTPCLRDVAWNGVQLAGVRWGTLFAPNWPASAATDGLREEHAAVGHAAQAGCAALTPHPLPAALPRSGLGWPVRVVATLVWVPLLRLWEARVRRDWQAPSPENESARRMACAEYEKAARTYRQLALAFGDQGLHDLSMEASVRAQHIGRTVLLLKRRWGPARINGILYAVAGYGYRIGLAASTWSCLVSVFFLFYLVIAAAGYHCQPPPAPQIGTATLLCVPLLAQMPVACQVQLPAPSPPSGALICPSGAEETALDALNGVTQAAILSLTSATGRAWNSAFVAAPGVNVWFGVVSAWEGVLGLFVEAILVATLAQRFLGKQ